MKPCINCQHLNESDALFCEECGTPLEKIVGQPVERSTDQPTEHSLEQTNQSLEEEPSDENIQNNVPPAKPISKKSKITLLLSGIIIVVLIASFSFGKDYYSKENQIDRFIAALSSEKPEEIKQAVTSSDQNFKITKENIVPYVDYLKSHKKYISTVTNELKNNSHSADIKMEKKGSYFLFFDKYNFNLLPVYIDVSTNQDEAVIKMNSEVVVEKADADDIIELGPLTPGEYVFEGTATINEKPIAIKQRKDFSLYNGEFDNTVSLDMTIVDLTLFTNVDSGEVYIDGEKISDIDEQGEAYVEELAYNDNMKIQLQYPVGEKVLKTDEVLLGDYYDGYEQSISISSLNFDILTEDDAEYFMNNFYSFVSGEIYYGNDSIDKLTLSSYFKDGINNGMYADFSDYIKTYKEKDALNQSISFDSLNSLKMVSEDTYEISYSVNYTTEYDDYEKDTVYQSLVYSKVTLYQNKNGDLKLVSDGGADNVAVDDY